jgi:hypothetical protein
LAQWFSGQSVDPGADEIWRRVAEGISSPSLRFVRWNDDSSLHQTLVATLVEELEAITGPSDEQGFGVSLGGVAVGDTVFYNLGDARRADRWRILTPVNLRAHGVDELNLFIQRHFRRRRLKEARSWSRKIPAPFGPERIVYGDKVMSIENQRRYGIWPKDQASRALRYVANGEIGFVIGQTAWRQDWTPDRLQAEFSSQPDYAYEYYENEFLDDSMPPLRLAYAITIHKAQGSEFGTTFIVLTDPLPMMSRELLYTALTRQQHKVVILHQGDLSKLKQFDAVRASEIAQRQTNLFDPPNMIPIDGTFLEDRLIHRTVAGQLVRSKSEVIVGDRLTAHDIEYQYELPIIEEGRAILYPDFTMIDGELGITIYWEHLGMLADPAYRARWERKLAHYRERDIYPFEEGGGENGTLVRSTENEIGGIDSAAIDALIREVFGR